uniref:Major facilitator superfamily (MFS) profile domain-containing protein n=2 Tax=Moniliophthora roreri TaxID=221103 RepID=A0A0W0EYQ7_MONRR
MPNEQTPLLADNTTASKSVLRSQPNENDLESVSTTSSTTAREISAAEAHNVIYERFTRKEKAFILSLVSYVGLIPLFVSGSFFPSIPDIAKDLNTTGEVVSLAVSVSVLAACFGALIGASFASFCTFSSVSHYPHLQRFFPVSDGRRPVYLCGLPLLCIGSVGVASSRTIGELMAWRFFQTLGVSFGISVGAGVIGDIYRLEERGTAMGIFFAACLIGPALAPFIGGFAAHYASWRVMQLGLGVAGLLGFICMALYYPETSIPGTRGIDKRRAELGRDDVYLVWVNPFRALAILRSPNITAVSLAGFFVLLTDYALLVPMPYTVGKRYGITNQAILGLLYVPVGIGNFVGAPFAGWLSDKTVTRMRKQRGGIWYPEDRLRATLLGAAFFVPLSVLGVGLVTEFIPGPVGLSLNLICLFFNGFGVDMVLSPSSAYVVDIMHSKSAESVAANNGLRSFIMAIAVSGITPMINHIGVLRTNIVVSLGAWVGFGFVIPMHSTHNTEVSTGSSNSAYDYKFDFISPHFASSSTSPDLLGFHCTNILSSQVIPARSRYIYHSYPSPPPSTSNPKRNVPLPTLTIGENIQEHSSGESSQYLQGKYDALFKPFIPLSPPDTVAASTSPLPLTDETDMESCHSDEDRHALLSPLSPEWDSAPIEDLPTAVDSDGILLSGHRSIDHVGICTVDEPAPLRHDGYYIPMEKGAELTWTPQSPESDEDYDMDYLHSPYSPPSSPESDTTSPEEPISFLPPFPYPSSPSIHPENIVDTPDSPSWRSLTSLPEVAVDDFDMEAEDTDAAASLTPPSPSSRPLSLPGAELDEGIIDVPAGLSISPGKRQSLLLLDEPDDVPTPRSPSPDNFDLDPSAYASCSDPDVAKLIRLRRKAQSLERLAKEREEKMLNSGWMAARAEARKERKKEKERVKEISAMLRLRLEEKGVALVGEEMTTSPSQKKGKTKRVISSMAHLVARMMFRRREVLDRPMVHTPLPPSVAVKRFKPSSPLRHSWSISDIDTDEEEDDGMDLDGLKGFDDVAEPMVVDESKRSRW